MYIPKRYGQSKIDNCPFCGKHATLKNSQSVPVCADHKTDLLDDLKCACGDFLDMLEGKYGIFFKCMKCGNMNLKRVMETNQIKPKPKLQESKPKYTATSYSKPTQKKEFTVRSDDPRYFS